MKTKVVEDADVVTYVVVCDPGDEAFSSLVEFARGENLAAAQITAVAKTMMPTKPNHGCHQGTPPGMAWRRSMTKGVKGGMNDMVVAMTPFGCAMTGVSSSIGIIIGKISRNARLCAS